MEKMKNHFDGVKGICVVNKQTLSRTIRQFPRRFKTPSESSTGVSGVYEIFTPRGAWRKQFTYQGRINTIFIFKP